MEGLHVLKAFWKIWLRIGLAIAKYIPLFQKFSPILASIDQQNDYDGIFYEGLWLRILYATLHFQMIYESFVF